MSADIKQSLSLLCRLIKERRHGGIRLFVAYLYHEGRLHQVSDILRSLPKYAEENEQEVRVEIATAFPPSASLTRWIQKQTRALSPGAREVLMEKSQDPRLIGGSVIRMGDILFDGSIQGALRRLSKDLGR